MKFTNFSISTNGNLKLRNSEHTRFIIWNLPAKSTCPYATNGCRGKCYACKNERYDNVRESRRRNFHASTSDTFDSEMIDALSRVIFAQNNINKRIIVRIHESGDFYNKEYALKWVRIAEAFKNVRRVVFLAYTKSVVFFEGVDVPKNLVIRASLWDDTSDVQKERMKVYPVYTAVNRFDGTTTRSATRAIREGLTFQCRCSDCANCGACWNRKIKTIACEIH